MSNLKHLKWLLEGIEAWEKRRELGDFRPSIEDINAPQLISIEALWTKNRP